MPGYPRPYWLGSRTRGRPCWAFTYRGKRHHCPHEWIEEEDAELADAWFRHKLQAIDAQALTRTLLARHRKARRQLAGDGEVPQACVWLSAAAERRLKALAETLSADGEIRLAGAAAAVIEGETARRAQGELPQPPKSKPRHRPFIGRRVNLRLKPDAYRSLVALADQDRQIFGERRRNISRTLRRAIAREWKARRSQEPPA